MKKQHNLAKFFTGEPVLIYTDLVTGTADQTDGMVIKGLFIDADDLFVYLGDPLDAPDSTNSLATVQISKIVAIVADQSIVEGDSKVILPSSLN